LPPIRWSAGLPQFVTHGRIRYCSAGQVWSPAVRGVVASYVSTTLLDLASPKAWRGIASLPAFSASPSLARLRCCVAVACRHRTRDIAAAVPRRPFFGCVQDYSRTFRLLSNLPLLGGPIATEAAVSPDSPRPAPACAGAGFDEPGPLRPVTSSPT
jgi:hypothetical protein